MSGRHRKPTTSAVSVAKIAFTGAVIGGGSLAMAVPLAGVAWADPATTTSGTADEKPAAEPPGPTAGTADESPAAEPPTPTAGTADESPAAEPPTPTAAATVKPKHSAQHGGLS